jgi:UDP-glucose 4-epimerase
LFRDRKGEQAVMRVVITGAAGFLGRSVVSELERRGIVVTGVSRRKIPGLLQVRDYSEAPTGDVLVHLAEANDRGWVEANSVWYEERALGVLRALLNKEFRRVVYASSAVLYGDQVRTPRDVDEQVRVVDSYTRLKHSSEMEVLRCNGVAARLANLYGPGMAGGNVLSTILKQLPKEGPVRVLDTTPVRDFLWVEDAAQALAAVVLGEASGIFNVGTSQGTSIAELAQVVLETAGQGGRPVESGYQGESHSYLVVDIRRTTAQFGWRPTIPLREGIGTLVKHYI